MRVPREFGPGDVIVKRMTLNLGAVTSTAAGTVALDTASDTAYVQSAPAAEWASFAARYQQYRVRRLRFTWVPAYPGSGQPTAGATSGHVPIIVGDFIGASVPGSYAALLSDERSKIFCSNQKFTFEVTWARNPNAKLWTATSASIPTANQYGLGFGGQPASYPATTIAANAFLEWDVELRGSQ